MNFNFSVGRFPPGEEGWPVYPDMMRCGGERIYLGGGGKVEGGDTIVSRTSFLLETEALHSATAGRCQNYYRKSENWGQGIEEETVLQLCWHPSLSNPANFHLLL